MLNEYLSFLHPPTDSRRRSLCSRQQLRRRPAFLAVSVVDYPWSLARCVIQTVFVHWRNELDLPMRTWRWLKFDYDFFFFNLQHKNQHYFIRNFNCLLRILILIFNKSCIILYTVAREKIWTLFYRKIDLIWIFWIFF